MRCIFLAINLKKTSQVVIYKTIKTCSEPLTSKSSAISTPETLEAMKGQP
jgi:hypothetical protein